jgi:hypothetical protein
MKRAFVFLLLFGLFFSAAGSALANHKPNHTPPPPSCEDPNQGPNSKHCYPPPGGQTPPSCSKPSPPKQCQPASFVTEAPVEGRPALTVGMVLAVGVLGGLLLIARRRWTGWLRRS